MAIPGSGRAQVYPTGAMTRRDQGFEITAAAQADLFIEELRVISASAN
jgi:hypothetical protein